MSKANSYLDDGNTSLVISQFDSKGHRREIMEELKKVLKPYTEDKNLLSGLNEQTNLITDLKINSANLVDIIIDAESKYNIEILPGSASSS
jgi:acyl carrier protein